MAHDFQQFMDDALADPNLLSRFETEYNRLYDAQGEPLAPDSDDQLSEWFDGEGYHISKGQCKKLAKPMAEAKKQSPITVKY